MNCPECGEEISLKKYSQLSKDETFDILRKHYKVCTSPEVRRLVRDFGEGVYDQSDSESNREHINEEWSDGNLNQDNIMIDIFRMQKEQAGHLKSISTALWVIVALMSIPMIISLIALLIMFT